VGSTFSDFTVCLLSFDICNFSSDIQQCWSIYIFTRSSVGEALAIEKKWAERRAEEDGEEGGEKGGGQLGFCKNQNQTQISQN
jgi:hypothetical protein